MKKTRKKKMKAKKKKTAKKNEDGLIVRWRKNALQMPL